MWLLNAYILLALTNALSPNGTFLINIGVFYNISTAGNLIHAAYSRVNQLNNVSDLIHPNAKLQLSLNISYGIVNGFNQTVLVGDALKNGFNFVDNKFLAVFGAGTTEQSTIMSKAIQSAKIPQCCCSTSSTLLSNKTEYPNFFRMIPNDDFQGKAILLFAVAKGWKSFSILYADNDYGKGLFNIMKSESVGKNITLLYQKAIPKSISVAQANLALLDILEAQSTVIVFAGSHNEFKTVFSVAKSLGMTSSGYAWICSDGVPQTFISSSDYIGVLTVFPTEKFSSSVRDEFFTAYWDYRIFSETSGNPVVGNADRGNAQNTARVPLKPLVYFAASCIDSIANGFDRFLKSNSSRTIQGLIDGEYKNDYATPSMFSFPNNITPSGYVELDAGGDRILTFDLINIRADSSPLKVATISVSDMNYTEEASIYYSGNTAVAPSDRYNPALRALFVSPSKDVGVFIVIFFVIGLLSVFASFLCLAFYRKRAAMNYISVLVHFSMLICLFVALFDMILLLNAPSTTSCAAGAAVFPFAMSAYYGMMFAKTSRIYSLYYKFSTIEDINAINFRHTRIGLLFVIPNIIIWALWVGRDPPLPSVTRLGPGQFQWICTNMEGGLGHNTQLFMIGYNAFLVLLNALITFKSRNIELLYQETNMTTLSVINLAFIFVIAIPILTVDSSTAQIQPLVRALAVFYVIAVNVGVMFLFKYFAARKQKDEQSSNNSDPKKATTKFSLPKGMTISYGEIQPAVVFLKRVDGLRGLVNEPKKLLLIAGSASVIWACSLKLRKPGESSHTVEENGQIWMYTPSTFVSILSTSEYFIELAFGSHIYAIVFEKEDICRKWKSYFEVWVVGRDTAAWEPTGAVPTIKSQQADEY